MKTIDLQTYRSVLEDKFKEVEKAEEALTRARNAAGDLKSAQTAELRIHIKNGQSTGDALVDGIITAFTFDLDVIDALTAFNKRLMAAKGQECLLAYFWRQRFAFRGDRFDEERDTTPQMGYILGKLTGESLLIEKAEESFSAEISFPFDGYVVSNMEHQNEGKRLPGRYALKRIPATTNLILFLTKEYGKKELAAPGDEYKILIGNEIENLEKSPMSLSGEPIRYHKILKLRDVLLTAPIGGQRELLPI
jgi:hypothetical protein